MPARNKKIGGVTLNFKKKILAITTAVVGVAMMGALFTGCSSSKGNDKEIKVGANFEVTGGVANYGNQALKGIKLAIKQANENGGVLGKQINLIVADNKSEASEAANAATKLISQDGVKVLLGPATTSNMLAASQIATDNKIPAITPTGTNPKITVENGQVKPYIFRSCFIDPLQGEVMADFATKTLNVKTAAIYVDSSSDYSKGLAEVFAKKFAEAGGTIVAQESFLQKDQDFKSTLTKLKASNPEVIFIPAYYEEVGKIVKQARELGIKAQLLGTDGWDDPKIVDVAGAEALEGAFFSNHYSPQDTDPNVVSFVEAYRKEYNQEPSALAVLGYDAALVVVDALKRAGSDDPEKIRQALEETKDLQITVGKISLDKNHNPIKSAVVIEMKNGKQVFKEKINPQEM